MKIDLEEISSIEKRISVQVPKVEVDKEFEDAYRKAQRRAKVKGFRPGKIPRPVLERVYGNEVRHDVAEKLFSSSYPQALQQLSLEAISKPILEKINIVPGEEFHYVARFEIRPQVEVREYKGFELQNKKVHVGEEEIRKELEKVQNSLAQLKPLVEDRGVQKGDFVRIDFEGSLEGKKIPEASATDYLLEIGSNQFVPGFEEQLMGERSGGAREIQVTFPENYPKKELAQKGILFRVTVKEIKTKELPSLNDEFAKSVGDFETLDQLQSKIRSQLTAREEHQAQADLRHQLVRQLIEKNPFDLPVSMIESELEWMVYNTEQRFAQQKIDPKKIGWDPEAARTNYRSEAEQRVRASLLLEAIARKESIEIEEGDLDQHFQKLSAQMKHPVEQIRPVYEKQGLMAGVRADLRHQKVLEFLLSQSRIS
ncbi:MAG: trigger factor [Deltaproteobacteria bacterium]|nr:trigger factor [Deltaproteobacteria bacterium]